MEEEKSLTQKIDEIQEALVKPKKEKKFKLPFRSRVGKRKIKKGWATVVRINENKAVDFEKKEIIDGVITLKDQFGQTFHAVDERSIFSYKGKPIIFQAKNKVNPYNPLEGKHETYGHKYILARLKSTALLAAKNKITGGVIFAVVIIGIIAYYFLQGGA